MSGTVMSPYAKTIALPGVETGKMNEKLTASAMGKIKYTGCISRPLACQQIHMITISNIKH